MKVHFHSDCSFFAGSENMLANLCNSPELRQSCEISFSYRANKEYTEGLHKRVTVDFPIYPLRLPDSDPAALGRYVPDLPPWLKRGLVNVLSVIFWYPLFLYDVLVLSRLFRRIQPQILHINNGGYPGALSCRAAVVAAKICRIQNILMVVNNLAIPYRGCGRWLDYPIDRLVVRIISTFVTGSRAAALSLKKVLKLGAKNVVSLHNGIKPRGLTEDAAETRKRLGLTDFNGVVFGVVALMERRKGHHVLLEALDYLSKTDSATLSNIMLLLEGDGPLRSELEDFVLAHGLINQVRFVGVERNIFNFLGALDVFVLSSIDNEDFPNVILEGMACGKPVIASNLAGTPEQVTEGETGLLVPPGESVPLADALRSLTLDHGLRAQLGVNGRQRFKMFFTDEKAVGRYLNLYQEMMRAN